jgi:hypothetical protein
VSPLATARDALNAVAFHSVPVVPLAAEQINKPPTVAVALIVKLTFVPFVTCRLPEPVPLAAP